MVSGSPFRLGAGALAVSTENRWLLAFSIVAAVVLGAGTSRGAPRAGNPTGTPNGNGGTASRGIRRRAGVLLALGPLVGLALAPSPDTLTVVAASARQRSRPSAWWWSARTRRSPAWPRRDRGRGRRDRRRPLRPHRGRRARRGVRVLLRRRGHRSRGRFRQRRRSRHRDRRGVGRRSVRARRLRRPGRPGDRALGLLASCFAFLAFNMRPASLFVGRGGRLAIGFALAVGVLTVQLVPSAPRELITPPMLVAVLWSTPRWWRSTGCAGVIRCSSTGPTISCTGWARSAGRRAKR